MFENLPQGYYLAKDSKEETDKIKRTIAAAFADARNPFPATDISYAASLRFYEECADYWIENTLKYGSMITNEDRTAVMLVTPIDHMCDIPFDELGVRLADYGTPEDASNMLAMVDYIFRDEETLHFKDDTIYVEILAVSSELWGRHESSKLMNILIDECARENRDIMLFTNSPRNRDIYAHFGFEPILEHTVEELNSSTFFMLCRGANSD